MAQTKGELKLLTGSVYHTQKTYLQVAAMQEIELITNAVKLFRICMLRRDRNI